MAAAVRTPYATPRKSGPAPVRGFASVPSEADRIMRSLGESPSREELDTKLPELRRAIILDGLETDENGMSPHRTYLWLLLLHAPITDYQEYASLLARGASPVYAKIKNDTFRTLATDPMFAKRVTNNSLSRLLNATAWTLHDASISPNDEELPPLPPSPADTETSMIPLPPVPSKTASLYVQGMNVLAAPLLYISRSEPQAYTLFLTLLTQQLPSYVSPTMAGVHRGLLLLDRLLSVLDPSLYAHLALKNMSAELYAFPSVLTLSACTPPLSEVMLLWDFLFAWGVHLNVLAVVAQLVMMREKLLGSPSPGKELRTFPQLKARKIVELVVSFVGRIDDGLYQELVQHTAL